jgi:hypothetical protein
VAGDMQHRRGVRPFDGRSRGMPLLKGLGLSPAGGNPTAGGMRAGRSRGQMATRASLLPDRSTVAPTRPAAGATG